MSVKIKGIIALSVLIGGLLTLFILLLVNGLWGAVVFILALAAGFVVGIILLNWLLEWLER